MATTKHSQNKCKKCGYTWYPRGKSISLKCPNCHSTEVGLAGGGIGFIALLIAGVIIFGGKKEALPVVPEVSASSERSPVVESRLAAPPAPTETSANDVEANPKSGEQDASSSERIADGPKNAARCDASIGENCDSPCPGRDGVKAPDCKKREAVENNLY